MTINFSELSMQEIREIVASGQRLLDERTDSVIKQKAQAITELIYEIYELVYDGGGNPDIDILDPYIDLNLLNIRDCFSRLNFESFQQEE